MRCIKTEIIVILRGTTLFTGKPGHSIHILTGLCGNECFPYNGGKTGLQY